MPCFSEAQILEMAANWLAEGHKVAIATVISTAGSAPRPVGSHLAVRDDGFFAGSVSAGCVESAVIESGLSAMNDSKHRTLWFGVSDEGNLAPSLTCGGEIEIFIEAVC